jgi:hypothetical protein
MAVYSADEREQKVAENLGYAGAITPTSSDYLQVLMQNHGANKIDVYMHEKYGYAIKLRPDGSALAKISVGISNKAPASGLPQYVSGENPLGAKGGYSNIWLNVYAPKGAQLLAARADGKNGDVDVGFEKDKSVFSEYLEVAPGAGRTAEFAYELPSVLVFDGDQIRYTLDLQSQPVINKPDIALDIEAPEGFEFSQLPPGFVRKGRNVFYKGVLAKDETFEFGLIDNR